ncbi:septum formation initiator family protein, partial [Candidatus Bipolaricaulota bacterium]|nr:septum formation initiator family protein [Candidatus Bipolaricaulota bacterium]
TGITALFRRRTLVFFLVVAILAAGFLGWIYWRRFEDIFALQSELAELKEERAELKEEISSLEDEVSRRNDPGYVEQLAREKLGLVYPPDEDPKDN